MTEDRKPRLPVAGEFVRSVGKLVSIEDVTPKEIVLDYIFQGFEARIEARLNGKRIKEFSVHNDFYGLGTCVTHAITEAKEQANFYGPSDLEFVVVKITSHCRKRPSRNERSNFYDEQFRAFQTEATGCKWNLPDDTEEDVFRVTNSDGTLRELPCKPVTNEEG